MRTKLISYKQNFKCISFLTPKLKALKKSTSAAKLRWSADIRLSHIRLATLAYLQTPIRLLPIKTLAYHWKFEWEDFSLSGQVPIRTRAYYFWSSSQTFDDYILFLILADSQGPSPLWYEFGIFTKSHFSIFLSYCWKDKTVHWFIFCTIWVLIGKNYQHKKVSQKFCPKRCS